MNIIPIPLFAFGLLSKGMAGMIGSPELMAVGNVATTLGAIGLGALVWAWAAMELPWRD